MLYTDPDAFISRAYDYVIIGGGVVGLVIAARLSEDPNVHVAVLEAGGYSTRDSRTTVPAYFWKTHGDPEFDWLLRTAPQSSVNGRRIPLPRGKTLGGTSVINTMTWFRGVREDYDALVELGNPGWGWDDWVPYFCKSETVYPPPDGGWACENAAAIEPGLSGTSGPLKRSFAQWLGDTHVPFLKSLEEVGVKPNPKANTGYNIGTFTVTTSVDPKTSQRSSSTTAYFEPNAGRRNLHVLTGATVNRTLIRPDSNGQYRATDVEFIHSGRPYQVGANKEVIICAGAYLSPIILERSGIGCSKRLRSLGIPDLINLPGVGENLQDHLLVPTSYELKDKNTITGDLLRDPEFITQELERYQREGGGMLASIHSAFSMIPLQKFAPDHVINKLDTMLQQLERGSNSGQQKLLKIQRKWLKDPKRGQLEIMHVPEFCTFGASQPAENGRYVSFLNVLMQPVSRGSVLKHASSSDPLRAPVIDPRYYHDRFDLEVMIAGLKYTQKLANTEPLASMIQGPVDPRPDQMNEPELEEYAKSLLESAHHPIGSNSMLPREDGGVVDYKLKATLYALGEKASDMIKEYSYNRSKL
ncbi:unnamed protein product [Rhizoctonia solani]|uniref:Glucose-methanol-choline oxidoreductase N-terminal domain-containing protein n=1 Tax=Rhizoctonia solani TaxID=456999 RepID=A0A8H3D0A5_9AGAM|nr:unnamed protein product [Rhizoctonia solani]